MGRESMQFIRKEKGDMARRNLERAIERFGDPMDTDKAGSYEKNLPENSEDYWMGICPECNSFMHAAYYTRVGVRYMCQGCGYKEGSY